LSHYGLASSSLISSWPGLNRDSSYLLLARSPSISSKSNPTSAFWNSLRCLLFRFTSITNFFLLRDLLYHSVMVFPILYMREIYNVRLELFSLLRITGTISPCSEAIDRFNASNSGSDGRGSKLRYSLVRSVTVITNIASHSF
jgi:hypothetical protein